jgi:outer membrane protein TolC
MTAGVTYRFPPARDAAAGGLQQAVANKRQVDLQYEDAANQTAAAVSSALSELRLASMRTRVMQDSLSFSRKSLEAEQEKLRAGAGSIINVITLQDRLTASLQGDLQARLAYAQALVRFRLATSTIVSPTDQGGTVDAAIFSTLPPVPPAQAKEAQK